MFAPGAIMTYSAVAVSFFIMPLDIMDFHHDHLQSLRPDHDYLGQNQHVSQQRLGWVLVLTLLFMAVEILAGYFWQSMALLADGWHMGSHAIAFAIAWFGYKAAKKFANHQDYSFGGWKFTVLAGFTSAVLLALIAVSIFFESAHHLYQNPAVNYADAFWVAVLGLAVNGGCALLLRPDKEHATAQSGCGHDHGHGHHHDHHHHHGHGQGQDLNLLAAYWHVLADALTSVLAIVALALGAWYGVWWLDPVVGMIGAIVIASWALSLVKQTAYPLLDKTPDNDLFPEITRRLAALADHDVLDLHLWQIGPAHFAAVVSLIAPEPKDLTYYRHMLSDLPGLAHLTVEISRLPERPPAS
jgi:cation diffusion facilitator family transporter